MKQKYKPQMEEQEKSPDKKPKWNGSKQSTRYKVQNNDYKDAQET